MTTALGAQQLIRVRASEVTDGRHGGRARDWKTADTEVIIGCNVQPFATAESTLQAAYVADRLRVFAPPGTDLLPTDRVIYDGVTFEVDGSAQRWHDFSGQEHHIELVIKRLAG
jgi:hypothetical protein